MSARHAAPRPFRRTVAGGLAALLVATTAVTAAILGLGPQAAVADEPTVTVAASGTTPILAGEPATYSITARNESGAPWFNLAFVADLPAGVVPTAAATILGVAPIAVTRADEVPGQETIPEGIVRYVWNDVVDLPAGGAFSASIPVTVAQPTPRIDDGTGETSAVDVHPVGSTFTGTLTAFASTNARLLPWFVGSAAVNEAASSAPGVTVLGDEQVVDIDVEALRVTVSEPSPESELLRGVHDHVTTYTITLENTSEGSTNGVEVFTHLEAGLEFLGAGDVDNSSFDEYPGSGPLGTGTPIAPWFAPVRVETIMATLDDATNFGLTLGSIYTRVVWLVDLEPGEVREIEYRAGIPLNANVLPGTGAPSPESLGQTAWLNNNTGPSTRHGSDDTAIDGRSQTTFVTGVGQYQGIVRVPSDPEPDFEPDRTTVGSDTETIDMMDVRVLKSVDDDAFVAGGTATYTLTVDTSEYADASDIVLIDQLGDGLCPIVPPGVTVQTGEVAIPTLNGGTATPAPVGAPLDDWPTECGPRVGVTAPAGLQWVAYDADSGRFFAAFAIDAIAASDSQEIVYEAFMRQEYSRDTGERGSTSATDSVTNTVVMTASTIAPDGVDAVQTDGEWRVADDSAATLTSNPDSIRKEVLPRSVPLNAVPGEAACDVAGYAAALATGFRQGDTVCYRLTVEFSSDADSRNPIVTDILPVGITVDPSDISLRLVDGDTGDVTTPAFEGGVDGDAVVIEPASYRLPADTGDRFVRAGSVLTVFVQGTVDGFSADPLELDKPENLMKFQQENVDQVLVFDRSQADIEVEAGLQLLKGVQAVNGAPVSGTRGSDGATCDGTLADCDGVEVREGDRVTYRVDISGGPTSESDPTPRIPSYPATGLVVWDRLPDAIQALIGADPTVATELAISASNGGTLVLPTDGAYPDDAPADDPALIVWPNVSVSDTAVTTLTYSLTVPQGLLIDTEHVNTASIISYSIESNTGDPIEVRPEGSPSTEAGNAPGDGTRDVSDVFLPDATLTKTLVSTEIDGTPDANNPATVIVHGEYATFDYTVTIPGNTSVRNGVLTDDGTFRIGTGSTQALSRIVSSVLVTPLPSEFAPDAFDPATGTLTFPELWTNTSADPAQFTVRLTMRVEDVDGTPRPGVVNLNTNQTLRNTASFDSTSFDAEASAQVTYREPNLNVTKTASPDSAVSTITPVTYTVRLTNATTGGVVRPTLYDLEIVDDVPVGLIVDEDSLIASGGVASPGALAGTGGTITWEVAELAGAQVIDLTYGATIDPSTGGGDTYVNTVDVEGHTLPADLRDPDAVEDRGIRTDSATEVITTVGAALSKQVRIVDGGTFAATASAPVGETVEYEIAAALQPNINYWRAALVDVLPVGVELVPGSVEGPFINGADVADDWTFELAADGRTLSWVPDSVNILSATELRTLVVRYEAVVTDEVAAGAPALVNDAELSWRVADSDTADPVDVGDTATVTVLNPALVVDKTVNGVAAVDVEVDAQLDYAITVRNTGNTPAFNSIIVDTVPAGVVVDVDSIAPAPSSVDPGVTTGAGGSITWALTDSIGVGATVPLLYTVTFVEANELADSDEFTNVVRASSWESFPEDGRSYGPSAPADADASPRFPNVGVVKATAGSNIALLDQPFEWQLTVRNTGDGIAETVTVTDTLPANWEYTATTSALVDGAAVALEPTVTGAGTAPDPQVITWTIADLPAGAEAVIRFTSTPQQLALVDAGVTLADGTPVPHLNRVAIEATDARGDSDNEDGPYAGDPDDAAAFIHSADLVVEKVAASSVVAGDGPQTGWTITVSNDGPDPAVGPITLEDVTGALPEGFTVTSIAGTGWTCDAPPTRDADGVTSADCTHPGPLASGASLPALTVTVVVGADLDPADLTGGVIENTATASSPTFDPNESNNESDDELPIAFEADLAIVKTLATVAPNAGETISWTLQPSNNGPSVSRSSTDEPITITDQIPAGVNDVLDPSNGTWSASVPGGFPADAGDRVTFTYVGDVMPLGATAPITLTGTIDSGFADGDDIVNEATIIPGLTNDPDRDNNTDDVTTTPDTDSALAVSKTRVVLREGTWVPAATADPAAPFVAGEETAYRVVVTAVGPADARGVTVVDDAPDGFTFDRLVADVGTWVRTVPAASNEEFSLEGGLVVGDSASFIIVFDTDPSIVGDVENVATADAENADPVTDRDDTGTDRVADLSIVKSHSPEAVAGQTTDITITVTNEGPSDASLPITVTDELPLGFSYEPDSAQVSVAGGSPVALEPVVGGDARELLTWTIGSAGDSLDFGETVVVTFTAAIASDVAAQTLVNDASVDAPEDPNPENDHAEDPIPVTTRADMSIVKDVVDGPWVAGTEVSYTLTITNDGPSVADARVVDALPAGLSLVSIEGADWICEEATASCERDAHPLGDSTITVTAVIDEAVVPETELVNVATLTWTDSRGQGTDEDDAPITVSTLADLGLVKTAVDAETGDEISSVVAGTTVRYLIEVTNYGPSRAASPLTVADVLPTGMTFVGVSDPALWECAAEGSALECVAAEQGLAVGETVALELDVLLDAAAPERQLVNTATVSSTTPEPVDDPTPNTDDAPVDVSQQVDLIVSKSHDASQVRVGEPLDVRIVASSEGPSTATGVLVTERLPAGLSYVDFASDGDRWSLQSQTGDETEGTVLVFALEGALEPGEQAPPILVTVMVMPEALGTVVNVVEIDADQPPTGESGNPPSFEEEIVVPPLAELVVTKEALVGADGWMVGDEVAYRITVTNRGPTDTVNSVSVIDQMPAGLRPTGAAVTSSPAAPAECTIDGQRVVCELVDGLAVGETVELTVTARLMAGAFPEIVNVVTIETDTQLTTLSLMEASAVAPVAANPLPFTGVDGAALWLLIAAIVLIALGVGAVIARRAVRSTTD